jgi:hypothetical protein
MYIEFWWGNRLCLREVGCKVNENGPGSYPVAYFSISSVEF